MSTSVPQQHEHTVLFPYMFVYCNRRSEIEGSSIFPSLQQAFAAAAPHLCCYQETTLHTVASASSHLLQLQHVHQEQPPEKGGYQVTTLHIARHTSMCLHLRTAP